MDMNRINIKLTPKILILISRIVGKAYKESDLTDDEFNEIYKALHECESEDIEECDNSQFLLRSKDMKVNLNPSIKMIEYPYEFDDIFTFRDEHQNFMKNEDEELVFMHGKSNQIGINYHENKDDKPIAPMYICFADSYLISDLFDTLDSTIFIQKPELDRLKLMYNITVSRFLDNKDCDCRIEIAIHSVKYEVFNCNYYIIELDLFDSKNISSYEIKSIKIRKFKNNNEDSWITLNYHQYMIFKNFIKYWKENN